MEEAKASLRRLGSRSTATAVTVEESLALIVATNEVEKAMAEGTSYLDTLRGTNRRRTEITCMTWGIQVLVGLAKSTPTGVELTSDRKSVV